MVINENQIFNLMDTNGRRNDVINALQGYIEILDTLLNKENLCWDKLPNSIAQYEFYKRAIEQSPEVFAEMDHMIICLKSFYKIKHSKTLYKIKIFLG